MRAHRIMANLRVADVEAAKGFYTDFLGLSTEEFNMGWVARYTSPETAGEHPARHARRAPRPRTRRLRPHRRTSTRAYEEAQDLGFEIVHPLTTEPWGVRRFLVRAPDGNVVDVVHHRGLKSSASVLRALCRPYATW